MSINWFESLKNEAHINHSIWFQIHWKMQTYAIDLVTRPWCLEFAGALWPLFGFINRAHLIDDYITMC